jgi:hypothetical protein
MRENIQNNPEGNEYQSNDTNDGKKATPALTVHIDSRESQSVFENCREILEYVSSDTHNHMPTEYNYSRPTVLNMERKPFLSSEDIKLLPLDESDAEFLRDGVNHRQVRTNIGITKPQTLADERSLIESRMESEDVSLS